MVHKVLSKDPVDPLQVSNGPDEIPSQNCDQIRGEYLDTGGRD